MILIFNLLILLINIIWYLYCHYDSNILYNNLFSVKILFIYLKNLNYSIIRMNILELVHSFLILIC